MYNYVMEQFLKFFNYRSEQAPVTLFAITGCIILFKYALSGLKNKQIYVGKGGSVKLEGRPATLFALFWLIMAILFTLVTAKVIYLYIFNPRSLTS